MLVRVHFRLKHDNVDDVVVVEFDLKVVLVLILSLKQALMVRMIFLNNIKTNISW
jgi:hypothetical protein